VDLGVHLTLMRFGDEPLSMERLRDAVDGARECAFAAVSANDHFIFRTPWLDGPTALASMIERSGGMTLATTVSLAVLRGPVALAKALATLDILAGGRLIAAVDRARRSAITSFSACRSRSVGGDSTRCW
jgi:alkanesulfonate monooxygenase SsuD/methylene tetrahydromethanopterin reductase-like flavin-dependent oxidoreductase (luciferase family)